MAIIPDDAGPRKKMLSHPERSGDRSRNSSQNAANWRSEDFCHGHN